MTSAPPCVFFLCSNQHFSSTNTGTETSNDCGGTGGQQLQDGDGEDPGNNQSDSSLKSGQPPSSSARVFNEAPASSRHFEENPLPSSNFKKPRSFKELPPANGEVGQTDETSASGKWESLHVSSTISPLDGREKGSREVETATKEPEPVFAQPTLRPRDMDAVLMPPPKIPGPSQLMKSEAECRSGLWAPSMGLLTLCHRTCIIFQALIR